jgi:hypothetical protein
MEDLEGVRELARARWSWHALVVVAAAALSSALIIGSYHSLSHTTDEPAHLAAGMEWLQFHRYTAQTENPPLSRIPLAVIPYVSGMRLKNDDAGATVSGVDMLYGSGDYLGNITRARVANLFFFWLLLGMTWVLSGGRKNPAVAIIATTVAATIPASSVRRCGTRRGSDVASGSRSPRSSARSPSFRRSWRRSGSRTGGRDASAPSGVRPRT